MAPLGTTTVLSVSALLACLAPVTAAPAPVPLWLPKGNLIPNVASTSDVLKSVTVTLSNGTTALPAPDSGLTLKAFAVGVGFQNYTCGSDTTAAPAAVGAMATLVNAADIMPYLPTGQSQNIMDIAPSFLYQVGRAAVDASVLPKIGTHYFSAPKTPTFDLTESGFGHFYGSTLGDIVAPTNATTGPNGAVDWLALAQNKTAPTNNQVKMVYRIYTASGKPAKTCDGQPATIQQPYSAQYLFFG